MFKRIVFSLLVIATFFSCDKTEQQNVALTQKMFAAFNAHNWQEMASCYAVDAQYLDPAYGQNFVYKSHQEIVAKYFEMQQLFPDIKDSIVDMQAVNNQVVVQFVSSGSSGDSIQFKLPICTVLTFANGKIVKDATYYDNP
jgi:ketosteroid isomerase-like protein